jgi:hypothetical protein
MWRRVIKTINKAAFAAALVLLAPIDLAAMQYPHLFAWTCTSGNAAKYATVFIGMMESNGTIGQAQIPMPVAGTFSRLRATTRVALTGAQTRTFVLMINGTPGNITVTLDASNQTATDTTNTDTVSAGDLIEWRVVGTNTPPADTFELAFDFSASSGSNVAVHSHGAGDIISVGDEADLLYSEGDWGNTGTADHGIVATAGTITAFRARLTAAPGSGNTRTLTIYKNGVAQDGSGGTPDTRLQFGASDTVLAATFSLSTVAGDVMVLESTGTGTPATSRESGAIVFSATATDHWNVGFWSGFGPPASASTNYQLLQGGSNTSGGWDATEANVIIKNGPTAFWLSRMRVRQSVPTGSGDSLEYTLRKNSTDQSLVVTIAGAVDQTGVDLADRVQIAAGDDVNTKSVGTGTPASTDTTVVFAGSLTDPGSGVGGGGGGFNALLISGLLLSAAAYGGKQIFR